uniref:hypothetical protein n=1 Tax=Amycolatopsis thermoflava TaxID=84480 RepID=UPI003F49EF6B
TGLNTVEINGSTFTNLRVLSTGAVQPFQPDDVVMVLRLGTQYFILGKVRAAGAGAAERIASASVDTAGTYGAQSIGDLPGSPGPSLTMYVGSARRVLVVSSMAVNLSQANAAQHVEVSGASSIEAGTRVRQAYLRNDNTNVVWATVTQQTLLDASDGLQPGQNTFTCKYQVGTVGTGTGAQIASRTLTVIPF